MTGATSLENNSFPYQPLDNTKQQIRVLVVRKNGGSKGIRYSLRTDSLDKKPRYRALSYQWGTGSPSHTIEIDGKSFYIRQSVHDFLQIMPVEKLVGAWFIDAICINQSDQHERAAQVRLMGSVYSQAQAVIAWLGPDHAHIYSGMLLRASVAAAWMTHPTAELGDLVRWLRMEDATINAILSSKRAASRSYWTRLWVVQEVLLATRLQIMLGTQSIPVKAVLDWAEGNHFHHWRSEYWSVRSRPASWLTAYSMHSPFHSENETRYPLYEALITFGTQESLDPRDTIFGLLGLVKTNIVPDYSLTATDVWLYALVEGLHNIHLKRKTLLKPDTQALVHDFVQACALALNFSPQHITVVMISRMAIERCLPELNVCTGYSSWEAITHHRPRSLGWHYLCQNVALLSRVQSRRLRCTGLRERYQLCVGRLVEMLQEWLLGFLRASGHAIPMPDGREHTYEDWEMEVERTFKLVKAGLPPSPSLPSSPQIAKPSPRSERFIPFLELVIRYAGCASGLIANIACGLFLALLGALLGHYADSIDAFRWHPWATDNWVYNVMAPFILLAHFLDIFTTAGRYPFAAQIAGEWDGIWVGS